MANTISIVDVSENIHFNELNDTPDTTISKIVKWLLFHIGDLNDLTQESFQKNGNDVAPQLTLEAAVILAAMYMDYWYGYQIRIYTGPGAFSQDSWTEIREGDTTFRRLNKNEIAKTIIQLKDQNKKYLDALVNAYKRNQCIPESMKSGLWSSVCGC